MICACVCFAMGFFHVRREPWSICDACLICCRGDDPWSYLWLADDSAMPIGTEPGICAECWGPPPTARWKVVTGGSQTLTTAPWSVKSALARSIRHTSVLALGVMMMAASIVAIAGLQMKTHFCAASAA